MPCRALTIPRGSIYFDNSLTGYSQVRFVYGSDQSAQTYVLSMWVDGNKWRTNVSQRVNNMYRFTFVGGDIREGYYAQTFSSFKDSISLQLGLNRTATSDAQMNAGDIFVPTSGDNWAQGAWMSLTDWEANQGGSGKAEISGTLPVVYVNTVNHQEITDTETQITASVYIDPLNSGYEALGSSSAPIAATIKGRGNWTWRGFDKKPYKIKFDVKQKVLGMPNNRHWCMMAGADDNLGFLRNPAGHMISEAVGLRWTPRMVPVEFVLNGQYMGLYFITEHVRIAANRIHIKEQNEQETNAGLITGGWLVEIDNYPSDNNITFYEGNGQFVMVSLKEPEVLSAQQRNYLETQIASINTALYGNSSQTLERLLDMDEAAKYYLVQEIMDDCESYHGSCFLYKDRDSLGVADKWKFGPVWDFGNSYRHHPRPAWIYVEPEFEQYWIEQLAQWPVFQTKVKENWYVFYHDHKDEVRNRIIAMSSTITAAAKNDASRWRNTQGYNDNSDMTYKRNAFLERYDWRIGWLYSQWGEGIRPTNYAIDWTEQTQHEACKILRNGQVLILRNGQVYDMTGRRVE